MELLELHRTARIGQGEKLQESSNNSCLFRHSRSTLNTGLSLRNRNGSSSQEKKVNPYTLENPRISYYITPLGMLYQRKNLKVKDTAQMEPVKLRLDKRETPWSNPSPSPSRHQGTHISPKSLKYFEHCLVSSKTSTENY